MSNAQLEKEVQAVIKMQHDLKAEEQQIMQDPKFAKFLQKQKQVTTQIANFWKEVETKMIESNIKSIKGDWGYITIAERLNWKCDVEELPRAYIKKVPDTTRLSDYYRLTNKIPKGAEPYTTQYLSKGIKETEA